jgi:hypothetical protein
MIIVRLLSPELVGWIQHHQLYSSVGADIVMESISLIDRWSMSDIAILRQQSARPRPGTALRRYSVDLSQIHLPYLMAAKLN